MALQSSEIKKIAIGVVFVLLGVYVYFSNFRKPLEEKQKRLEKELVGLREQAKAARDQIARTKALTAGATAAEEVFAQFEQFMKEGAPVAWFPPQVEAFFDRHAIKGVETRIGNEERLPEPDLAHLTQQRWSVRIPQVGYLGFGVALAALENELPILEVQSLRLALPQAGPEFQTVEMAVSTTLEPRD